MLQPNKIEAIYAVREAAEKKAVAETKAESNPTPAARDALLAAKLQLDAKTQDAIEACHECGHVHASDEPHGAPSRSNIIEVQFGENRDEEDDA